ncbi:MAG: MFS transporter [Pirellulales bacterium]|nr:MFS transporter [Pirellulales bacterium]
MPMEGYDRTESTAFGSPSQTDTSATISLGRHQWLVLAAAMLGWMFDGLEMGLFPIVARPALQDLLGITDDGLIGQWNSYLVALFLAGAACGGLLFGWLGDRVGRVRTMALSILAYSFFTGCCYFATAPWQLGVFRFFAALGMGGEWALGVALVMECWPDRLRPILAGVIGAAGNMGYLVISILAMCVQVTPQSWRWTMLACSSPALLAFLIIIFIPESKRWQESVKQSAARPILEIFTTRLLWPTLLAILFASIPLIATWGGVSGFLPLWADQLAGEQNPYAKAIVQFWVSVGAIIGCMVGPLLGGAIGRRPAYFSLCLASLIVCSFLFRGLDEYNTLFLVIATLAGGTTASFYGWLPLYLPELFPTRVRATGQGLSFNFGRIFAMIGVLGTGQLMQYFEGNYARACATITLVYVFGMLFIWLAPETKGKPLPE